MFIKYFTLLLIVAGCILAPGVLRAQNSAAEAEYDSAYAVRIQLEEINDVYIPKDVEDAFAELRRLASPSDLAKFSSAPEDSIRGKLHFGLGKWMIVNWSFYEGSRLSHYLKEAGLVHPDDMAEVLIVCFHRELNGLPLRFEEEVEHFRQLRDAERIKREENKKVISEETHIRRE